MEQRGSLDEWRCGEEDSRGNVERMRQGCGDDDQATVIKSARVEQVHEAHEVAATGRHDRREEA